MPFGFQSALLSASLLGALLNIGVIAQSIAFPASRIWPVSADCGRFKGLRVFLNRAAAPIIGLSVVSILALAVSDIGSLRLPAWFHISMGVGLFAAGGSFGWMGFRSLGPEISLGIPGELQVRGPYRISRNPQYVGAVGVLAGLALLSNSLIVLLAVAPWCLWFWLAPLAEEPWLQSLLGDPYASYAATTKRYL